MSRKKTKEEFVEQAKIAHNNFYDYSNVDYINNKKKIKIICPIHGEFLQTPANHLNGQGCPECAGNFKSNLKEFVQKANKIHNNFYDYSIADYVNSYTKIKIICPIHGEFEQTPDSHLRGSGCPKCAGNSKSNAEEFVEKAKEVHNNFYDYSKVDYVHSRKKIKIICPIHGLFEQTPDSHLSGHGCPECAKEYRADLKRRTLEEFIEKANKIHNNFYDYSNVDYIHSNKKVKIICPIHGVFEQAPYSHLNGVGCPKCANEKLANLKRSNSEEFVEKAKEVHNNFYDYSKVDYVHAHKKVKIICPIHGVFEQTPASHLSGSGCSGCWRERLRELQNSKWSDRFENGILYLIECWNDFERFVKIGLTSRSVEERYRYDMPYNYSILKELRMDSNTVSDTEQYIIEVYESYKPSLPFGGDTECLSIDEKYQILEFLENLEKDLEVSENFLTF